MYTASCILYHYNVRMIYAIFDLMRIRVRLKFA